MTAREMMPAVGQVVELECSGLWVRCTVRDVKEAWGKPRFQVEPIAGSGQVWVEFSRLRSVEPKGWMAVQS